MRRTLKKSLVFRWLAGLSLGLLIVASFGQGCGKWNMADEGSQDQSSLLDDEDDPDLMPNTPTVSLVYGKQILDHYSACLGSGLPSDRTLAMTSSKSGTISENGAVSSLTAPMLMAATSVAGEVCQDLITNERSTPRIFIGLNFSATSLPAENVLQDAMIRIARSCWSRDPDPVEKDIILDALRSAYSAASGANLGQEAALFMCTSMLSALDSLVL